MASRMEAQKVLPQNAKTTGPEVSIEAITKQVLSILEPLPLEQKLKVLKQVEAKIKPTRTNTDELVRKVIRTGRSSFYIRAPSRYSIYAGNYTLHIKNEKAIYERHDEKYDVKVRIEANGLRIPLPKWAYEQIGSPSYVKVRFEDSRIIVEPARY